MSSPEAQPFSRARTWTRLAAAALVVGFGAAALSGCQVRPLYADLSPGSESSVQAQLKQVSVAGGGGLQMQQFRKELIFRFYGGGSDPTSPLYRLTYTTSSQSASLAVPVQVDEPSAVSTILSVDFALIEISSGLTLLTGTSFASASYDYSSQRFANTRAAEDAQRRVAVSVAQDVANRIAAYFAAAESR
ncbi:hypothetical protein [Amorphus orientalis]|uniref:LPS-assembly lipoprotein n=1 Tax=Amorphus orientalis TaxID=649198 RepID=A0AAE4AS70_9HYPH|nr:hypothetical protein [Amorphus orientalis]MDQ0313739.1 LPS-assembly lipoprotein [Amorphus orientalis]